ncbi:DUF805 domain-containing protein [Lacticaseibacillus absianus]|uniref:DUF805 domain-containing protein n=1 Tax=Lacticaseibacillus absianus TaxID=2729623 RepID=UPI0015CCC9D4|nr:DUF805 domain-containing protein [Lacticaseibacillus absianus]
MIRSYQRFWRNMFILDGTASRSDYWWPILINHVLGFVIVVLIQAITGHPIEDIYTFGDLTIVSVRNVVVLLVALAGLTVSIRRLHDTDHSGWWYLVQLIPLIGTLWYFVLTLLPGKANSRWRATEGA